MRMRKKLSRVILLFAAVVAVAAACSGPSARHNSFARTVTDDLGRKVALPEEVTRVVSLAPNITEIVFAVGAGDKLVGVTTFCNYPAAANQIKKVGDTLKPNIETIVALRPQVVLVSTASQLEGFIGLLDEQQISVLVTNPSSVEGVFESMAKIGEALGKSGEAKVVVARLRERVEGVRESAAKIKYEKPQTVFVQIDPTLYTIGKASFITDLVKIAGGRSVTGDLESAYPKVSREAAKAYDPSVIILSDSPDNREPNDVFADSEAVRDGRIVRIDADVLSRPGPRIVDALELIFKGIRGETPNE